MKLVHSADFHLNKSFSELSGKAAEVRRSEQLETVGRICNLAKDADVLLLCGDLLDTNEFDKNTMDNLCAGFQKIPDTKVFIVLGNHDPFTENSPFRMVCLPDNVHIFGNKLERVSLPQADIYGMSYSNDMPRLTDITIEQPDKLNILLFHGELNGSQYYSVSEAEIGASGFDYIAMGHVHAFSGLQRAHKTWYAYPGVPEPTGFDETGEKGIICGTIEKNFCGLRFEKTCKRQYRTIAIELNCPSSYEEIVSLILEQAVERNDLYKIVLKGFVSLDFIIHTEVLQEKLQDSLYFCKIRNQTRLPVPYEAIAEQYSLRGIFVKNMLAKIRQEPEREDELMLALQAGLAAMEGKSL